MSEGSVKPLVSLQSLLARPALGGASLARHDPEAARGRVVTPMGPREVDEEDAPHPARKPASGIRVHKRRPPLPPATAKEPTMPRGVYPRKPRAAKGEAPGADQTKPVRKAPKAKRAKKSDTLAAARGGGLRALRAITKARNESINGAEPNFVVDDAGRIAIVDGDARIDLSAGATKRLAKFIEQTKGLRS